MLYCLSLSGYSLLSLPIVFAFAFLVLVLLYDDVVVRVLGCDNGFDLAMDVTLALRCLLLALSADLQRDTNR